MRTPLAVTASVITLLVVAGCSLLPQAQPTAPPSASAEPSPSASPSASPTQSRGPLASCESLITLQVMYDFNSNVALDPDYAAPAGSLVERVAATGVECGWVNLTSKEVIAVAAGQPGDAGLAAFRSEFSTWTPHQWDGADGYFTVINGEGHAAAVTDGIVLVIASPTIFEPGDVEPLVAGALSAL